MTIGNVLKHARAKHNLTMQELGKKAGIQYAVIHAIEGPGKRTGNFNTIERLFAAMEIDILAVLMAEIDKGTRATLPERKRAAEEGNA